MTMAHPLKKQKFSSFTLPKAFNQLGVTQLQSWKIQAEAIAPSAFFQERLSRLQRASDLRSYEESKKLLIDAICKEASAETAGQQGRPRTKITLSFTY